MLYAGLLLLAFVALVIVIVVALAYAFKDAPPFQEEE